MTLVKAPTRSFFGRVSFVLALVALAAGCASETGDEDADGDDIEAEQTTEALSGRACAVSVSSRCVNSSRVREKFKKGTEHGTGFDASCKPHSPARFFIREYDVVPGSCR